MEEKLPYLTRRLFFSDGSSVEEFIIPDEDRQLVLEQLYPFNPLPKMTDRMIDIHTDKVFTVKEFRVTWEGNMNCLVSPFYAEGGGSVIDWMDEDSEENDWAAEDDSDEDSDDDLPDDEDEIPF